MASTNSQNSPQGSDEQSLVPAIRNLFQGIGINTVKGDPEVDRQFRLRLHRLSESMEGQPSWQDITAAADSANLALRDHNERATKYHRSFVGELRSVIEMLVETLQSLTVAGPKLMQRLQEIEKEVLAATTPGALSESKISLGECLAEIRKEAESHSHDRDSRDVDPITGLPQRSAAETALAAAAATATVPLCAVALMVDRLDLYNRRYGRDIGDKILAHFVTFAKKSFGPDPALFRWTGPSLVAIRKGSPEGVQAEMRKIFDPKLEFDLDVGSRSVLLSIGASWSVVPMMVDSRLVINKIDAFAVG